MKRHQRIVISALVAVTIVLLYVMPEKPTYTASALFARDQSSAKSNVNVTVKSDSNNVSRSDHVLLTLAIENGNAAELTDFYASISAPGFEWDQNRFSSQLPVTIPARSTAVRTVPLAALAQSGSYNVVVSYNWTLASYHGSVLSIGPIRMTGGLFGEDKWIRFGGRLKDLALPIVLAALGFLFQQQQKNREERQQVRQNILPLVMTLAEQHYMPIVRGARLLIDDHEKWRANYPQSSIEKVFFDTLFVLKRMDHLRRDKGQIFFQDGAGEKMASDVWFVLREGLHLALGEANVALPLKEIQINDGFPEFQPKILKFKKSLQVFQQYVATNGDEFRLLEVIRPDSSGI